MYLMPPDGAPPKPAATDSPKNPTPAGAATAYGEPFHPQLKIYSFEHLLKRIVELKLAGQEACAADLRRALESALNIKIMLEAKP